jgi:hypothetical protein
MENTNKNLGEYVCTSPQNKEREYLLTDFIEHQACIRHWRYKQEQADMSFLP